MGETCHWCGAVPPCPPRTHRDPEAVDLPPCSRCGGSGLIGFDWPAGAGRRTCPACRGCGVEQ